MDIFTCYNDDTYQDIIVEILNKYDIDNLRIDKQVYITEDDFALYKDEIKCLKKLKVIDDETNKLDKKRFIILRNYIKRNVTIGEVDREKIILAINELIKEFKNNKEILMQFEKLGFRNVPGRFRFYSYQTLDIWSIVIYHGLEGYNKLLSKYDKESGNKNITNKKVIYKDKTLYGKKGTKKVTGYQYQLCELIFKNESKNIYKGIVLEEDIYGQYQTGSKLKSLMTQINKKLNKIGYENNVLSYQDEEIIRNISTYI